MSTPESIIALLTGNGAFDLHRVRAKLLALFGGEEGWAVWLYELAENPETSPATKAKIADLFLEIMKPGQAMTADVTLMSDDELKRMAERIASSAGNSGA